MLIYKAILKNGYSNFSIEILEYCTPENCIEKENYYFEKLKPEYNLLKIAGSNIGYKHTKETLSKLSTLNTKEKNPFFGKTHSKEAKIRIIGYQRDRYQKIEVVDLLT